ncbi:MAG: hypothetical protein ACFCBU_16490 [Cyanophyceae cyanobacterium]
MEVIVHIGMPKTGTTALQRTLAYNRDQLRDSGILYPEGFIYKDDHKELVGALRPVKALSRSLLKEYGDDLNRRNTDYDRLLGSIQASAEQLSLRAVVLSAEGLFNTRQPDKLQKYERDHRKIGARINLVVYIRDPAGHYLSHAQQVLKASHILPRFKNRQYRNKISRFVTIADRLTVAPFERDQLRGGDITKDFMGRIFPNLPHLQKIIAPQMANETMSAEAMEILQEHRLEKFRDQPNIFTEETDHLRHTLTHLDRNFSGYTRPRLLSSARETVIALNTDLLWLYEHFGISFKGITPQGVSTGPTEVRQPETVADICQIAASRREALTLALKEALHSDSRC